MPPANEQHAPDADHNNAASHKDCSGADNADRSSTSPDVRRQIGRYVFVHRTLCGQDVGPEAEVRAVNGSSLSSVWYALTVVSK